MQRHEPEHPALNYTKLALLGLLSVVSGASLPARAAAPGEGCGKESLDSGVYTMDQAGISRTYRIFVPSRYDSNTPAPVIFLFHGWGGDENAFLKHDDVTAEADRRGYILVAPRGLGSGPPDHANNSWSFSGSTTGLDGDGVNAAVAGDTDAICDPAITPDYSYPSCAGVKANTCSWTQCRANDVDFVIALVKHIGERLCVDADRVFASGGSNGGMFVWELGQNPATATIFKAIAPIVGLPQRGYLKGPGKKREMPVLLITGTQDRVVPPGAWNDSGYTTSSNGKDRYYYTGATAITRSWARAQGCDTSRPAVAFDDGSEITDCRTYCSASAGWPRVLDCRASMGHDYGLSWSWKLVLDFFDAHSQRP